MYIDIYYISIILEFCYSYSLKFVISQVDIEIRFEKGDHGDGYPFDGRNSGLAHSPSPFIRKCVHFDDLQKWTINNSYKNGKLCE